MAFDFSNNLFCRDVLICKRFLWRIYFTKTCWHATCLREEFDMLTWHWFSQKNCLIKTFKRGNGFGKEFIAWRHADMASISHGEVFRIEMLTWHLLSRRIRLMTSPSWREVSFANALDFPKPPPPSFFFLFGQLVNPANLVSLCLLLKNHISVSSWSSLHRLRWTSNYKSHFKTTHLGARAMNVVGGEFHVSIPWGATVILDSGHCRRVIIWSSGSKPNLASL